MSNWLSSLFKKELPCANCSPRSLQKSNISDSLVIQMNNWIALKKQVICSKNVFFVCFWQFSPFLCPRVNRSHRSSLSRSFLKSDGSNSLSLLFKKEQMWANRFCRSLQKSDREQQFAPIAHDKRATRAIHSFPQANRSFANKKHALCFKKPKSEFPTLKRIHAEYQRKTISKYFS